MKLTPHNASKRSIHLQTAFSIYYAKVSTWGHRAWDNGLVIYAVEDGNLGLARAEHVTAYDHSIDDTNRLRARARELKAAYVIYYQGNPFANLTVT